MTTFKGEKVSFWVRLIKKMGPILLVFIVLYLRVKYGKTFAEEYKIYFYIFGILCLIIGFYYHIRDIRTVVTEIRFDNEKIQIIGLDFNSNFNDMLNINNTRIEVKQKEKTEKLYLEIFSDNKYYYINNYSDWKRETVVDIVKEYRKRTVLTVYGIDLIPEISNS